MALLLILLLMSGVVGPIVREYVLELGGPVNQATLSAFKASAGSDGHLTRPELEKALRRLVDAGYVPGDAVGDARRILSAYDREVDDGTVGLD